MLQALEQLNEQEIIIPSIDMFIRPHWELWFQVEVAESNRQRPQVSKQLSTVLTGSERNCFRGRQDREKILVTKVYFSAN